MPKTIHHDRHFSRSAFSIAIPGNNITHALDEISSMRYPPIPPGTTSLISLSFPGTMMEVAPHQQTCFDTRSKYQSYDPLFGFVGGQYPPMANSM